MNRVPSDHLPPCFLDLNWDRPSATICDLAAAPDSHYITTTQPLNSPPDLHLSMMDHHHHQQQQLAPFAADPGFVERAARLSCFGGGNNRSFAGLGGAQFGSLQEAQKLSRVVSGCHSLRVNVTQLEMGSAAELGNVVEESSSAAAAASDTVSPDISARKRKVAPKGKGKDLVAKVVEELSAKRSRYVDKSDKDEVKLKVENNGSGGASSGSGDGGQKQQGKDKPMLDPHKDYIHVRARRGQATDSHSLAERVRREKISERMKLLQDLVPGCNKVTGKALMLDEIINYVQSLQRQVEFLSMKLASVNPQLDFNVDSVLPKDMHQNSGRLPRSVYSLEASAAAFSYNQQPQQSNSLQCVATNGLESQMMEPAAAIHRALSMQLSSLDGFVDAASQLGTFWEDDLQNVVQMGFGQNQEMAFPSQGFHDQLPASHMKIEL